MKINVKLAIFLVVTFLLSIIIFHKRPHRFIEMRIPAFGTMLSIHLSDRNPNTEDAIKEIIATCQAINNCLNVYNKDSEVSKLNLTPANIPFHCSPILWDIIVESIECHKLTDGCFDITISPLMKMWGFRKNNRELSDFPKQEILQQELAKVGSCFIILNKEKKTMTFTKEGMAVDFGGIAKGYALLKSKEILEKHHIKYGMLNFGGNIYALENPNRHDGFYIVEIKNPNEHDQNYTPKIVKLKKSAIATSGSYENRVKIAGKDYGHIIHPQNGMPVDNYISVTVHCANPLYSDVFSTAIYVGGEKIADKLKKIDPSSEVIVVK